SSAASMTTTAQSSSGVRPSPAQPDGLGDEDRVLAVDPGGEQALLGRPVVGQETGLGQDPAQPAQLASVLVDLAFDFLRAGADLAFELADLAVLLDVLSKPGTADHLELALPLEKTLELDLEVLGLAARHPERPG